MPTPHSTKPVSASKASTCRSGRMSSSSVSVPNCWPPMACREPAIDTAIPAARASRTARTTPASDSAGTMRSTRVSLRREWTSLTRGTEGMVTRLAEKDLKDSKDTKDDPKAPDLPLSLVSLLSFRSFDSAVASAPATISAAMPAHRPLAGLRVIDASRVLAGPYLSMLLGDLGADVVKIEKPEGGDQTRAWGPPWVGEGAERVSAYFVSANRNKRSVALDLKRREARAAFERLLAGADVLVENFLPAEWRKLGFRSGRFTRKYPRLVQCTVSGYGTAGAEADRPAYDVVLQAESGLMSLTGFADGEPVRVGVAIVDILSALYGLSAVLAALHERQASGRGRHVEVSMADSGAAFLSYAAQS